MDFVSPLLAVAKGMAPLIAQAQKSGRESLQSLLTYSKVIEDGVIALLNEPREILSIAIVDLDNDNSMALLRRRIDCYLYTHHVYEPLKLAVSELDEIVNHIDTRSETAAARITDLRGKRRAAIDEFKQEFLNVHGFLDALESTARYLPSGTGLAAPQLQTIFGIIGKSQHERIAQRPDIESAVASGRNELAATNLTVFLEELVRARRRMINALS